MDSEFFLAILGIASALIAIVSWMWSKKSKKSLQDKIDEMKDPFEARAREIYREQKRR